MLTANQDAESVLVASPPHQHATMGDDMNLRMPALARNNFKLWHVSILAFVEEHGLTTILTQRPTAAEDAQNCKNKAHATRLITSILSA